MRSRLGRFIVTLTALGIILYGAGEQKRIVVVSNGWHAGLVFNTSDIDPADWPQSADFDHFEYIEAGWGDEAFYRSSDPGWWLHIRGAMWPTPSVLHIRGFDVVSKRYPDRTTVNLSAEGFRAVTRFVSGYYEMEKGSAVDLGPGLTHNSRFYRARYPYHLFRTCNAWVAEALNQGGMDLHAIGILTTEQLFEQLESSDRSMDAYEE